MAAETEKLDFCNNLWSPVHALRVIILRHCQFDLSISEDIVIAQVCSLRLLTTHALQVKCNVMMYSGPDYPLCHLCHGMGLRHRGPPWPAS